MSRLDLESRLISAGSYRNDMTIFRKVIVCVPSSTFATAANEENAMAAVIAAAAAVTVMKLFHDFFMSLPRSHN